MVDWICTVTLLRNDGFYEANPLMQSVVADITLGFLVKCILPACLMVPIWRLICLLEMPDLPIVDRFVSFVLVLYTAICAVHIVNFAMLLLGVQG
ncbi:MAG: hypothetical protein IJ171_03430 [Ruminococcus sp.]|nr:hypothetical protein [Ruminococcus sp.]